MPLGSDGQRRGFEIKQTTLQRQSGGAPHTVGAPPLVYDSLNAWADSLIARGGSCNAKAVSRCAKAISRFFAAQSQRPSGGGHWLSLRKERKPGRKKRKPGRKKRKLGRKKREQGRKKREQGSKKREFGRRKWGQQAWGRLLALILSKHGAELSRYSLPNANQPQSDWTEAGSFVGGRMVAARVGLFVRHGIRLVGRTEAARAVGLLAHFKV